jgi:hypothetical protein
VANETIQRFLDERQKCLDNLDTTQEIRQDLCRSHGIIGVVCPQQFEGTQELSRNIIHLFFSRDDQITSQKCVLVFWSRFSSRTYNGPIMLHGSLLSPIYRSSLRSVGGQTGIGLFIYSEEINQKCHTGASRLSH